MTAPNTADLVGSSRRLAVTEPALREVLCRRCGSWMTQQPDMTWWHTHDDTICCIDPDTLEEVADPR